MTGWCGVPKLVKDVDIVEAVEWIMFGVFWTNGQICSSTSRLLIHENIAKPVLERLAIEASKITVGGTVVFTLIEVKQDQILSLRRILPWDLSSTKRNTRK